LSDTALTSRVLNHRCGNIRQLIAKPLVGPILRSGLVAIVSTIVASWFCALKIRVEPRVLLMEQGYAQIDAYPELLVAARFGNTGACRVFVWWGSIPISGPLSGRDARAMLPPWAYVGPYDEAKDGSQTVVWVTDARGWPCLCLRSQWELTATRANARWISGLSVRRIKGGVRLTQGEPDATSFLAGFSVLPLRIMWGGFMIDVVAFGCMWLSCEIIRMLAGNGVRSWRRRGSRCIACGYSLKGLREATCPECGWASANSKGESRQSSPLRSTITPTLPYADTRSSAN